MPRTRVALPVAILLGLFLTTLQALGGDPLWSLRATEEPPSRSGHAMAYDSARGVTVLFGGGYQIYHHPRYFGDTWEWDGSNWWLRSTTGPSPRSSVAMAYDDGRGVTVLFGGNDGRRSRETWEWDGREWSLRSTRGPRRRNSHAMVYDSARGVTVLYGGWDGWLDGETWEWNGRKWSLRSRSGPTARPATAMAYDRDREVTVLFGGGWNWGDSETWEWDGMTWVLRSTEGPSPRLGHAMVYDTARRVTRLFGGSITGGRDGQTWEWDGNIWSQQPAYGPNPRSGHAMAYDSAANRTVLFGGYTGQTWLRDAWEYGSDVDCRLVTKLKTLCDSDEGRIELRGTVSTTLRRGTQIGLCIDPEDCTLDGNETCRAATVNAKGKAKALWSNLEPGEYCVIASDCPLTYRKVECHP